MVRGGDTKNLRRSQELPLFEKLPRCLEHNVRLMPVSYVKAYVKHDKNDAADAAAICEAATTDYAV
jgi:transposase